MTCVGGFLQVVLTLHIVSAAHPTRLSDTDVGVHT